MAAVRSIKNAMVNRAMSHGRGKLMLKAEGHWHGAGHLSLRISTFRICHLPPASLGHYAALSFVVIG